MTTISLYSAANTLSTLLDNGIDEDGVISPELEAAMVQFETKGQAVVAYILSNRAQIEIGKAAVKHAQERLKAEENRIDRVEEYLMSNMKRFGISSIEADGKLFGAKFRKLPASVDVFDSRQIPAEYMRQPETPPAEPDKKAIAAALKEGKEIPGAKIITDAYKLDIR